VPKKIQIGESPFQKQVCSKSGINIYTLCTRCDNTLINEPKENKATAKANDKLTVEWKKNKKKLESYLYHDGSPLMKAGKAVSKDDVLKFKEVVIMCHCWQNKHRLYVGGAVCVLQCKD
jgi:hypothetical protein